MIGDDRSPGWGGQSTSEAPFKGARLLSSHGPTLAAAYRRQLVSPGWRFKLRTRTGGRHPSGPSRGSRGDVYRLPSWPCGARVAKPGEIPGDIQPPSPHPTPQLLLPLSPPLHSEEVHPSGSAKRTRGPGMSLPEVAPRTRPVAWPNLGLRPASYAFPAPVLGRRGLRRTSRWTPLGATARATTLQITRFKRYFRTRCARAR